MQETIQEQDIDKSLKAEAASAHSRINVPLNMENWRHLPEEVQQSLLWLHQHALDNKMSWDELTEAVGYDRSTVFRWLKGTYEGSWQNALRAIKAYRRIIEQRGTIKPNELVENGIYNLIAAGLDYALANNSITAIIGESRMGKTVAAKLWRDHNNHGTSVYVVAPPYGGTKRLLHVIAEAVGVNRSQPTAQLYAAILRAFNKNRILIVDEAHRLLPSDRRSNPTNIEVLRDIHDQTGCALAFIATQRFDDELRKSHYQFEQILGRIGMPIRLPRRLRKQDWLPIVRQYVEPDDELIISLDKIANGLGRLGILVESLKLASRIAAKAKEQLTPTHVHRAIALRAQMMGERMDSKYN
ncbi:MAG: ATP-binding protein [candidate division KSB1 bacterium]|nr:ATP-binding protein [candidate division KSB1 bacterium]